MATEKLRVEIFDLEGEASDYEPTSLATRSCRGPLRQDSSILILSQISILGKYFCKEENSPFPYLELELEP